MFRASEHRHKAYKVGKMEDYKSLKVSKETHKALKMLSTEQEESIIAVTEKALKLGIEALRKERDQTSPPSTQGHSE